MNKIHRVIWSVSRQAFVVVSELAPTRGKASRTAIGSAVAASLSVAGLLAGAPLPALAQSAPVTTALPAGGQVVAGEAAIRQGNTVMDIDQSSQRAAIDWQTFNVGKEATVNFHQPSTDSVTLNRVADANASQIFGRITANGQVFLSNPNGVYFAPGASVDVGGLVATTHAISLQDFLGGQVRFERNGASGSVVNDGELRAALGGYVALLAPEVRNEGLVLASTVALAAGERIDLHFDSNNSLASLSVQPSTLEALVENRSAVLAPGGLVILSARAVDAVRASVINSGEVSASSLVTRGGRILLEGHDIDLQSGSVLTASGATGGGEVLVGGDWQGSGAMHQATQVALRDGAVVDVSATAQGDGGKAVLWSDVHEADSSTLVRGTILARGAGNGAGGQIETSGHAVLTDGARIDAGAESGPGGLWLLDPYDYLIDGAAATTISNSLSAGTGVTIDTVNNTGAGAGAFGNGDITVGAAIAKTSGVDATLTLKAARHIVLQGGGTFSSNTNKLNLLLWADSDNSGDGIIQNASTSIGTNGGWLKFGNNQTATLNGQLVSVGGDVYFNGTAAQTIDTAGGAMDVFGETIIGNPLGVSINTAGGSVGLHGVVNSGNRYTWVDKTGDTAHDWSWARTDAINGTGGRSAIGDSYLVTITSRLENAIAGLTAGYRGAWIGAWRANPASSYAWTWADGPEAGKQFFTQVGGGGGSAAAGYYANFGAGEPNGALNGSAENVGQFFGTAGQWNDLTIGTQFSSTQATVYSVLGYVRETNTATSPLTINAGSGTVTFDGAVGGSKALATLDVTAGTTAMNGGSIATEGLQAYRGPVRLGVDTTLTTRNSDILFGGTVDSANPALPRALNLNILPDTTYYWADWTSATATSVSGTITIGSEVINVTYSNPNGYAFAQTNGGTAYWTYGGGASPYVSANVANGPTGTDIVALRYAGSQTLTFSQSVENLAFSLMSINGNGYGFDQDFNIESYSGYNGAGSGYYGTGGLVKNVVGSTYQLNDAQINSPSEPHGTIRFTGAFSTLTWQSLSNEYWNGFTVGVSGTSASAGAARFEGAAGATGALGAVSVNGALRTTADISNAASLSVSGAASLAGNVTTSGNQSFNSAVTLGSDATLTTTSNGNVGFVSTVNGPHALTVSTQGSGDTTFGGAVGGATALTGLAVSTDVLSAGAIRLATGATLGVANTGTSAITGVISGTNAALTKSGGGTLTLSGANTFSGGSTISGGVLKLGAATTGTITSGPLGTGAVAVSSGGALDLAGYSLRNALSLAGTGVGGNGALYNSTGTAVTVSGNTTLTADASVKSESGGTLNLNGAVDGAYVLSIDTDGPSLDAGVNLNGILGGTTPLAGLNIDSGSAATTLSAAVSTAGPVSLQGASVALNAPLTASGTVTMQATGAITDGVGGYVNAGGLRLLGGTVTLDNVANNVDTLAASGVGALTYVDANGLTLGSLGATQGVSATGALSIATLTGDLAITQNVATSNATAAALVLNAGSAATAGTAAGGNILVSGSPTVSVGSGGTARLYTGAVSGSTGLTALVGSGSGRFRYNSDESASNYSQALATGLNAIYRERPTATFGAASQTLGYGTSFTPSLGVNSQNGDTAAQILTSAPTLAVGGATSSSGNLAAGDHAITLSGGGTDRLGYAIASFGSGTLTVTPRALTYTGTATSRVYDGSTAATVIDSWSGGVVGDDVSVSSTAAQFTVDGNAGTGKSVAVTGIGLTGADLGNYTIGTTATTTGDITPRTVALSGNKVYDGTTALGAGAVSIVTGVGSQTLGYAGATAQDAHVAASGNYLTGITLQDAVDGSGGLAANYALPTLNAANAPVTITPRALTSSASIAGTLTRTYDGTTTASGASVGGTVSGGIAGDTLTLDTSGLSLAYDSAHAATASAIVASGSAAFAIGASSAGSQASDYSFTGPGIVPAAASITPAVLTPALTNTGVTKVYDGTTAAPAGFVPAWSVSGLIGGDTAATVASTGATYDSSHVAEAGAVTVSGLSVGAISGSNGSLASDYALAANSANVAAAITPRNVTVAGVLVADKVYDGTANALVTHWGSAATGISGETLALSATDAAFTDVNAGANRIVTVSGYALADGPGGRASDYQLTSTSTSTTASITPAPLLITAYDDARFVTQADTAGYGGVSYSGLVNGETSAVLGGTLSISRSNGGTDAAGRYDAVLVPAGLTSSNYAITYANGDYLIVPAQQLLVRAANTTTTYGTTVGYGVTSASYLNGADVLTTLTLTASDGNTYTFDDGVGGAVTFTLAPEGAATSGSGHVAAGSYRLTGTGATIAGTNFDALNFVGGLSVAPKAIAAVAGGVTKVYDGTAATTNLTLDLTGVETGDTVTVDGTGQFAQRNVGSGLLYSVSDMTLAGPDGGNYRLIGGSALSGSNGAITPAALNVSGIRAADKVYDGSTTASVSTGDAVFSGLVAGDDLRFAGVSGAFSDKNVGGGKTVTLTSTYAGADLGNYAITDQSTTTAAITRLDSVTWVGGASGNWFDPANWAGGAVPDLANVANVVIPAGVVVSFDTGGAVAPAQTGPVQIDSLGNAGGLSQANGALAVSGGVTLGSFAQTGGTLGVGDDFTVNGDFSQSSSGSITVGGDAAITDTSGGTFLGNLQAGGSLRVDSSDGDIVQVPGTRIAAGGAATLRAPGAQIRIAPTGNAFASGLSFGENLPVIVPPVVPGSDQTLALALGPAGRGAAAGPTTAGADAPRGLGEAAATSQAGGDAGAGALRESGSGGLALDGGRGLAASGETTLVSLVRDPAATQEGLIRVDVAQEGIDVGFTFVLPRRVLDLVPPGALMTATREDGGPLPAWLRFEAATGVFTGSPASAGALPINVIVEVGAQRWMVAIARLED